MDRTSEADKRGSSVGQLRKRPELMEDGRRYIIYFTFGESERDVPAGDADREAKGNQDV